jgi:RNA polymerase sigma-70 factor (ECF subfamily)
MANTPDDLLVQSILQGNRTAFRVLVERYQHLVFSIALRITNNRQEAEEVAQDVFLKVYNNLHGFKGESKFSSWLYRIAYNTALTRIRNKKPVHQPVQHATTAAATVVNEGEHVFMRADLDKTIALLEPDEAVIITLYYFAGNSVDEIASVLNIEPNAAKVRLFRARKKLRENIHLLT